MTAPVSISFKIEKADKTGRFVAGWLSVVKKDGKDVVDTQEDRIDIEELRKGVHKYMRGERVIKKQHSGDKVGEMVEVLIIDDDVAKALGATTTKRGAWGMAEITDEATRADVRKGKVTGWSMGGRGKRTPIAKAGFAPLVETDEDVEKAGKVTYRGQRVSRAERRQMATKTLPALRRHEGSWIARAPSGGYREFFSRGNAQRAMNAGWKVKTAGAHLGALNRGRRK